ncbi:cubilin [Gastrophryne carolinensis]
MNTMGSHHCGSCPPGYEGDGQTCNQINVCSVNNGGCHPLAACAPTEEALVPVCVCPPGYAGDGYGVNGCQSVHEICQQQNPCVNGICKPGVSSYICECDPGWTGTNCSVKISNCSSNPCLNGGICIENMDGYMCNCSSGWTGFHCETQTQACGGNLLGLNGTLSYPNNPGDEAYGHMVSCSWVIRTEPDKELLRLVEQTVVPYCPLALNLTLCTVGLELPLILRITFPYFDLENSSRCSFDFLQIHDGDSTSALMLGKFCGSKVPNELLSSHNALYLWFKSDEKFSGGGFQVNWESRQPECGGHLSDGHGLITSPGYPGNYPPNRDCYWTISTEPGLYITFAFGTLSLEHHESCENDYLEIWDGLESQDTLLGKYCSTQSPAPLQTSGPYAWVHFHSDATLTDRGFHISYTTSSSGPSCGGNFTDTEGFLTSPSWPDAYTGNKECIYIITQKRGDQINLRFTHMNLQSSTGCSLTVIEVKDGDTQMAPLIGRYCNSTIPAPITSSSNTLWLKFRLDASATASSFKAFYQVVCGGMLSGTGVIRTPHYPNPYYRERTCEWIIAQPEGEVVQLNFDSFNLLPGTRCSSNYIEIRDGPSSDSTLIGTYCGPDIPPPAYSTQRSLYIKFVTDASSTNGGFSATYRSVPEGCGGTLTALEGTIASPSYPAVYPHGLHCTWLISVPPGNLIRLTFHIFILQQAQGCSTNYLEIYDNAPDATGNKIGRYCGKSIPPSITSSDNLMVLIFVSDSGTSAEGFSANYISINASTTCDVVYTEASGEFTSPNYPDTYPNNRECVYTITAEVNKQIMLNFTSFKLHWSTDCTGDFVEIRDGGYATSPFLGRFCKESPPLVISHSNKLWIKFRSDSSITNAGFSAHWNTATTGCSSTLTELSGAFASPNYPMPYYGNSECYWILKASRGSRIQIEFEDFHLESVKNCINDYLANGAGSNGIMEGDASHEFQCGFHFAGPRGAVETSLSTQRGLPPPNPQVSLTGPSQTSLLDTPDPSRAVISEGETSFDQDSLNKGIHLGVSDEEGEGSSPQNMMSEENSVLLEDIYDTMNIQWVNETLFVQYSMYHKLLIKKEKSFPINSSLTHFYEIMSRKEIFLPGSVKRKLYFECSDILVLVYNGNSTNSALLEKLCGRDLPAPIQSTSSDMYVKLRTDMAISYSGFLATYKQICQGVLIANRSSGILESPNYPNSYPANQHCNWTIQTTTGNTISYMFTAFYLEGVFSCNFDYVKLYDGPNDKANLTGTYCRNELPPSGTTNGTSLHVVFHSDTSGAHQGFQLMWNVNGCGGDLSGPSGSFNSPGYPMNYPHNRECIWHIVTSPGSSIQISLLEFIIEYHDTCSYDVLEIYGGHDLSSPRLAQLCGPRAPGNPLQVSSTGNMVTVRFKTDSSSNGKGFNATWSEVPGGCGGIFQSPSGEIHSPNYPRPYDDNTECSWLIRVSSGHRVLLSFTDFDVEPDSLCSADSVMVYDGESGDAAVLAVLCGEQLPSNITSSLETMFVRLRSDRSKQHKGFSARFNEVCGGSIVTDAIGGTISSPLYPGKYPNDQNCTWIIQALEPFNHVTISFTDFDTENRNRNCSEDFVEILDGNNIGSPSKGRFCGQVLPHPVTSFSNALVINFVSNNFSTYRGFHATYAASTSACGGVMHMENGAFNSPGYPENYLANMECIWNILSSPGNQLQLSFMSFSLQESENCAKDYLEIREGNATGALWGKFCGNTLPINVSSIFGHVLWIKFVSDGSISGSGFRASFSHLYGNNLEGSYGQIASPLWPRPYPDHSSHIWKINVESHQIIEIRILEIDIEYQATCIHDRLRIYDGPDIHYHIMGTYCGAAPPPSLFSSGSSVTVQFISDGSIHKRGFLLEWTAIDISTQPPPTITPGACGGVLRTGDTPFFLFSPGWPNDYLSGLTCTWVIRSPESTVELNLLTVDIEAHSSCNYDKLVIRDGDNILAPELTTVCGREIPGPIRSSGDSMFLYFTSDRSGSGRGFNASYHKSCGGYLHANRGLITSPNYPGKYPPNQNCTWHVLATPGFTITVHFEPAFEIQSYDATCSKWDYLELRNGPDALAPPLGNAANNGKFCGWDAPSSMHTTNNELFVHFSSDTANEAKGFKLHYEAKGLACGGTIHVTDSNPVGSITSPNYPNNYPQNSDCLWTIIVPNGEAVQLDFQDQFHIEPSENCSSSYLELRDGADSNQRLLAKLCGNTLPVTYKSLKTAMYLRFRTDSRNPRLGFKAQYSIASCGGTLFGQSGVIQSPGHPSKNYSDSFSCNWSFNGPTGHYLNISFESLDLQSSPNCSNDYIEIREYNESGNILGKFCGNKIPDSLRTSDSFAYVKFVSDESITAKGFRLQYEASIEECGGDINGLTGSLKSPNYPNLYPHGRVCEWRITVPQGRRVTLTINDLRLQDHESCDNDYVSVYNGYWNQSPLLHKLCSNVAPNTMIKSTGNTMKVLFVTDGSVSNGGFKATFTSDEDAVCGGLLTEPAAGNFTSPGYDEFTFYAKNQTCEWIIQNPNTQNSTTFIEFKKLQLEQHQNCLNDFIEIRLDNANGELIKRICGRKIPAVPLALVAPQIWVRFVSNNEVEDIGFHAQYSFTGCGGMQIAEAGFIMSPSFPKNYPARSHCAWHLEAPEGHIITLTFTYFDLEYHSVCLWDSVTIVNGALPGSPLIGQYCGTTSPGTVQSGSNKLLIIFNADNTIHGGGFSANWTSDSLGCGGYLHADSGDIKTPGWPLNFPINSRCTWTIQTHESSHFEITFNETFNIPDSTGQCLRSFVKVWNGVVETEESLLQSVCGNSAPAPVISQANIAKFTFQSQDDPASGFSARFIRRCGAVFTKQSGQIVSSNYPDRYENSLMCNYTIHAESNMYIVLTFVSFELESSSGCQKDSVKIYSGAPPIGRPLEILCGSSVPAPVSTKGTMLITFNTDSDTSMHGFLANYMFIPCGGTYNRTFGIIRSPTYSYTDYHPNMNCTYHITVQENNIIELKFNNFDLEASSRCAYDYVAVYEGSDIHGPLLGTFCGKVLPPLIRSSSNNLFLVFHTDTTGAAGGWTATFRQTLGPLQGCGGYLTNTSGSFSSPDSNNDGKYDKGMNCVWTIGAAVNKEIRLEFSGFSLEAAAYRTCRYDFVKIFDGSSTDSSLQGTYCGSAGPAKFTSNSNFLTVWFVSDGTVELAGFNATYEIMDLLCGGIYNATSGITTMTSPDIYPPFTTCVWTIDSPPREGVKLSIQMFHLQPGLDCAENYLELRDSPVGDYGQVHKFCGSETHQIPDFYSYGRTVVVTFKLQEFVSGNKLNFTYQTANCNREYNQSFGNLKSPGWPENYPYNIECTTILRAPDNHYISLFFYSFQLESIGSSCHDYLEIRNGSSLDSPALNTYCGNKLPNPVFAKNNALRLFFKSDIYGAASGFVMTWTSSLTGCGGTLFGDYGSFTSPEYPASYTNNTDCEWTIVAPMGRSVRIEFTELSIDDPGDCENNYIRFNNGPLSTSPVIGSFCGLGIDIAFNTTSHQVFVKFHADTVTQPSNFRVIWKSFV